ncbi:replication initiation and membrane attachment family protein [Alteribacillus sp. HJP-4]|uniref:replication initiation and membrane attachment family protein n=1 Tax=Alteribacillus sp. HJP-4 TaxID=2775394 RepID=UPI0035CD358E
MALHWTELLPVDRFAVRSSDFIGERDQKTLTLLYQPLIGTVPISLFQTLWSKLERDCLWSSEVSHHELMVLLNLPLDDIFAARQKLEAIGLIRTFKRSTETTALFIYELQRPMTPAEFFQNDVLSVFLYNKLGRDRYIEIRSRFLLEAIDHEAYQEVTASFNDIFTSLQYSEMLLHDELADEPAGKEYIGKDQKADISFGTEGFDFELLKASLPAFIDGETMLTEEIKWVIRRLAFVYRLEPLEMSRMVQQSLTADDTLNPAELRKKVQDWYRFEYGPEPPALGYRVHPKEWRTMDKKEPATNEEKMVRYYEQTSPLSFLESISDGAKVPSTDVKLVESLLFEYQLQPGIVNVLIDYVMQTNNMKLHKTLVQKIAGHWSRKQLKSVKDAMELAKKEHRERKHWKENGSRSSNGRQAKPYVRKDRLPKWLENEKQVQQEPEQMNTVPSDSSLETEKQRFEAMLKQLKNSRQK